MNQRHPLVGIIYKITFTQQIWRNCYIMAPFVSATRISFAHGEMMGDRFWMGSRISFREYMAEAFKFYFSRDTWTGQYSFGYENLVRDMTSGLFGLSPLYAQHYDISKTNIIYSFRFPHRGNIFTYSDCVLLYADDIIKTQ